MRGVLTMGSRMREATAVGLAVPLALLTGYLSRSSMLLVALLGAGFGVALLTVFILRPKWGVLFIVALFGLGTYSNFGGTVSIYGLASIGVAGAWLVSSALTHRIEFPRSRIAAFVLAFLLLCIVSLAWASDVRRGITWLIPLSQATVLCLLIGVLFRSRRDIHLLVGTLIVSTGFGAAWGVFQEYTFRTGGWQAFYATNTRGTGALTIGDSARISGTFFNPASLATYALVALVFSVYLASGATRTAPRILWTGLSALFVWSVLATLSRGPIGVLLLLLPISAWYFRRRAKSLLPLALVAIPLVLRFAPSDLADRLSTAGDFGSSSVSNGERLFIVRAGITLITDYPLLGVGYANFPVRIAEYMGVEQYRYSARDAHNILVEVAGETGLIGLAIFLAGVISALASLRRCMRASHRAGGEDVYLAKLAATCMVGLVAILLVGLTTPIRADRYLYFMLGLAIALEASLGAEVRPAVDPPRRTMGRPRDVDASRPLAPALSRGSVNARSGRLAPLSQRLEPDPG